VFGSWWRLEAGYSALSDGSDEDAVAGAAVLCDGYGAGARALPARTRSLTFSRYSLGKRVESLQMQERKFDIGRRLLGRSARRLDHALSRRVALATQRDFEALPSQPDVSIPATASVAYPWVGIEVMQDEFVARTISTRSAARRILYLGLSARLEAGFETTAPRLDPRRCDPQRQAAGRRGAGPRAVT
jgi:hypothetical protein